MSFSHNALLMETMITADSVTKWQTLLQYAILNQQTNKKLVNKTIFVYSLHILSNIKYLISFRIQEEQTLKKSLKISLF